jgi:hypothetical protein
VLLTPARPDISFGLFLAGLSAASPPEMTGFVLREPLDVFVGPQPNLDAADVFDFGCGHFFVSNPAVQGVRSHTDEFRRLYGRVSLHVE